MSLQSISSLTNAAQSINKFSSFAEILGAGIGDADFNKILNSLKNLPVEDAVAKLGKLNLNLQMTEELLTMANSNNFLKSSTDEVTAAINQLNSAGSSAASELTSGFSGVGQVLKSLISTPLGIATAITAVSIGVMALADALTVSYDEVLSKVQGAVQTYTNFKAGLDSLSQQYQNNQSRIEELNALKASDNLSSSDSSELSQLQAQNQALETQINAKKQLLEIDAYNMNAAGEEYLSKKDASVAARYDDNGQIRTQGSRALDANIPILEMTDADAITASIQKINFFKEKLASLKDEKANASSGKEAEKFQKEIDQYQEAIDAMENDMAERAINMISVLATMTDTSSEAYRDAQKALTAYNTRNMSQSSKDFAAVSSFFSADSTDSMTDYFTQLAKTKQLTEDTFLSLGFTAESFGVANLS